MVLMYLIITLFFVCGYFGHVILEEKYFNSSIFIHFCPGSTYRFLSTSLTYHELTLFSRDSQLFGYNLVFFPNQIYYVILSSGLGFYFAVKLAEV